MEGRDTNKWLRPRYGDIEGSESNYGCIRYHNATGAISGWLQFKMVKISIELLRNGSGCEPKQGGQKCSWIRWLSTVKAKYKQTNWK